MQDDVSMFVFLPDEVSANMTLLEESLSAEFVQDLSMTLLPAQVSLTLPVLKFSFSTNLLPLLGDVGELRPPASCCSSSSSSSSSELPFLRQVSPIGSKTPT